MFITVTRAEYSVYFLPHKDKGENQTGQNQTIAN